MLVCMNIHMQSITISLTYLFIWLKQEQKRKEILLRKQRETYLKTSIGGVQMMRQIVPSMVDNIAEEQYKKGNWKQGGKHENIHSYRC